MKSLDKLLLKLGALAAAFGFVYDTPVFENKARFDRILYPEPIALLDDSYAFRPYVFETGASMKSDAKTSVQTVPVFNSDNPVEIEEMLRNNPVAYDIFENRMRWVDEKRAMSRGDFLRAIAKLTRELNGAPLRVSRACRDDALVEIISGMHADYFSNETLQIIMDAAVEISRKEDEISLYDLTRLPFLAFNFGHSLSSRFDCQSACKNPELIKLVADFYSRMVKAGCDIDDVPAEQLAGVYGTLKDLTAFSSFTSLLEDYAKSVLKIDKDIVGDAVKVLFSSGPISNVGERSELLLRYIRTLADRGELEISRGLEAFGYRRNGLDSGFVDKILALHEHYGILQFSRLQKNDGDESLIEELLKNADPDYRKDKPLAVVCVGREGAEIAFDTFSLGNFYDTLKTLSSGYRLMVYSVASESGPFDALAKARSVAGRKADLLVLAGHGSPSGVGLGGKAEDQVLDLSDSSVIRSFEPMVSESGRVVLYSCSTGAGRNNAVNIANHFAFNLPGRIVYAPDAKTTGVELRLDSAGLVDDIRFLDSERAKTGTYSVVKPR